MRLAYLIPIMMLVTLILAGSAQAMPDIEGTKVVYSAKAAARKGYLACDKNISGRRPGVLVVHEWWGLNDYARKRARMLAKLGYAALAVDMYGEGKAGADFRFIAYPGALYSFRIQRLMNMTRNLLSQLPITLRQTRSHGGTEDLSSTDI